jgi:hypothetical protein
MFLPHPPCRKIRVGRRRSAQDLKWRRLITFRYRRLAVQPRRAINCIISAPKIARCEAQSWDLLGQNAFFTISALTRRLTRVTSPDMCHRTLK